METKTSGDPSPVPLSRRKRLTHEQRRQILTRFHEGELTQQEFAAREGMSVSSLCSWLREERESATATVVPAITFQELKLPSPSYQSGAPWVLEIVTPQNWTLRLAQSPEPGTLQQLLRALPC